MPLVLFLCSGNYYRSRFAEAVFNHRATAAGWNWRAFSRGLAVHLVYDDLSPHTRAALQKRGIALDHTAPTRQALTVEDLHAASHVIALKEAEHRLLLRQQFPDWEDRVEYWHVHDLDCAEPHESLPEIERLIDAFALRVTGHSPAA